MKRLTAAVILFNLLFAGLALGQPLQTVRVDNDTKDIAYFSSQFDLGSNRILFNWNWYRSQRRPDLNGFVFLDTALGIRQTGSFLGYPDPASPPRFAFTAFRNQDIYGADSAGRIVKYDNQGPILVGSGTRVGYWPRYYKEADVLYTNPGNHTANSNNIQLKTFRFNSGTVANVTLPVALKDSLTFSVLGISRGPNFRGNFIMGVGRNNGAINYVRCDSNFNLLDSTLIPDPKGWPTGLRRSYVNNGFKVDSHEFVGVCTLKDANDFSKNYLGFFKLNSVTGVISNKVNFIPDSSSQYQVYQENFRFTRGAKTLMFGKAEKSSGGRRSNSWATFRIIDTSGQALIDTQFQFVPGMSSALLDVIPLNKDRYILIGSVVDTTDSPSFEKDLIFQKIDLETWKPVSLKESSAVVPLSVFPNPAHEVIHLNTTVELARYRLYSLDGRVLAKGELEAKKIPLPGLSAGRYLLEVQSQQGDSWIKKVQIVP